MHATAWRCAWAVCPPRRHGGAGAEGFSERLAVYGYWPWGKNAPVFRKAKLPKKPAILISSCAAPSLLGRLTYGTNRNLKVAAKTMGGKIVGSIVMGMVSQERQPDLPSRAERKIKRLAPRLVA
jgi:hypothetical protein